MFLIAVCLIVYVSPSMQLKRNEDLPLKLAILVSRSPNTPVVAPKDLFFCSLKAKRIFAQRRICERSFELQQDTHHCANRRLLIMRLDHQLAYLQKMALLAIIKKGTRRANECSQRSSYSAGKLSDLTTDIALLQGKHINLTRHQSKLPCVYPRLKQMMENITGTIAEGKAAINHVKNILIDLTKKIESNDDKLNTYLKPKPNETSSLNKTSITSSNLTACHLYLSDLVMDELNCSSHILPTLQEKSRAKNKSIENLSSQNRAMQDEIQNCHSGLLQCQASDVCDKLQTAITKGNQSHVELQQVTDQLAGCSSSLTSVKRAIPRCEAALRRAQRTHHDLLVNVTAHRIRQREQEQAVMQCETQLSTCHENITVCRGMSAELGDGVAGCWSELDKWRFRTDLCEGQVSMLLQNINATEDYIGDMRSKLRTDQAQLEVCQDRQLYHRSGHAKAVHMLDRLAPELNTTRVALTACYAQCPHLQRPTADSRCPQVDHGIGWHQSASGCFFVTRPGAGHSRMQEFCARQAPGARIAVLSSAAMAQEAYAVLLQRYMGAARTEPLRRQRRAWVDFADGFEYAGHPAKSPQCRYVTCACWTMRFPWKGRSQLYECEQANLPAICFVPLNDA